MLLSAVIKRSLSSSLTLLCFSGTRTCTLLIGGVTRRRVSIEENSCNAEAPHLLSGVILAACALRNAATGVEERGKLDAEGGLVGEAEG